MALLDYRRRPSAWKQQTGLKSLKTQAPSGGLVDIDQEVVTLRGPFGTIPGSGTTFAGAPILVRQPQKILGLPALESKLTHRLCKRGWLPAATAISRRY
jgi:hypothetical protein